MIEMLKDLADPIYWLTVVPVGVAFLGGMWKYDEKQAQKKKDSDG